MDSHQCVSLHDYISGMLARLGDIIGELHAEQMAHVGSKGLFDARRVAPSNQ